MIYKRIYKVSNEERRPSPGAWDSQMAKEMLYRWKELLHDQVSPALSRRLVTGDRVMLARVHLKKGCVVPRHQHEHEQLTYVMAGALRFWLGEDDSRELIVRAEEVLHLPSDIWHGAEALEESEVLDVFSPPRQDWIDKTDSYLRR